MSVKNNVEIILDELKQNSQQIDDHYFKDFIKEILNANHIFLLGKGRSGLAISAFANRLMHLGLSVSFVGEISAPHTKPGDLLIIGSGSGETTSLISLAKTAIKEEVKIALLTTNPESTLASLSNSMIVLPGASKLAGESQQPMASAFEQLSFIVYDAIVLELMKKLNETSDSMFQRHANFE